MSSSSPPGSKVSLGSSTEEDENSGPDEALGAKLFPILRRSRSKAQTGLWRQIDE